MKKTKLFLTLPIVLFGGLASCSGRSHVNVGLFYCSSEPNSLYQVSVVEKELEKKGLSTTRISFPDATNIDTVLRGAIDRVDALFIPTDNTCASNSGIIDAIVREKKVPVFAGEGALCEGCGAITLSISYYNIGVKTAEMAADVLLGEKDIATMPIAYDDSPVKQYNKSFCEEVGVTVPSDYVELGDEGGSAADLGTFRNPDNRQFTVGVSQLLTHPALDAATQGFVDALKVQLGEDNVNIIERNAAGQIDQTVTIANYFVSNHVDLIMANATPALVAAAAATDSIPVLGTSITEYGVALNIKDFDGIVGGNVSGTSDLAPLDTQAQMLADVFAPFFNKNSK